MDALGRLFDVGTLFTPVDLNTADGATGKRINMQLHDAITVVMAVGVEASAGVNNYTITAQQHTAYTGGTSSNLASATISDSVGITYYYVKSEATLDNDEAWVRVAQTEAATIALSGATYGQLEKIVAFDIRADQLGAGYTHASVNISVTTANAILAAGFYLPHEMHYQRKPQSLFNLLNPGQANV